MKKIFVLGACAALCLVGAACQKEEEKTSEPKTEITSETLALDLYADYELPNGGSAWVSSDQTTVRVVNGKLIALKEGTAEVNNSSSDRSYNVQVTDNGQRPYFTCEGMQVAVGDENVLETRFWFMGKEYVDYSVSFSTAQSDVIELESSTGAFTALKDGEATVSVTAAWRNVPTVYLTKEVTVNVVTLPETTIAPSLANVELYTADRVGDQEFQNEESLRISVVDHDKAVTLTEENLSYSVEDPTLLEIEQSGESFLLVGKKSGETVLTFTYKDPENETKVVSTRVNVSVRLVMLKQDGRYQTDTDEKIPASIRELMPDFTSLKDVTEDELILYDGNTFNEDEFVVGDRVWQISNGKYAIEFACTFASKIVKTEKDFLKLYDYLTITDDTANKLLTMDGYILLAANLDFSSYAVNNYYAYQANPNDSNRRGFGWLSYAAAYYDNANAKTYATVAGESSADSILGADHKLTEKGTLAKSKGFIGVLDGQGYTVKGLRIGAFGIFPSVGTKGVIKNIAFADTVLCYQSFPFGGLFAGTLDNSLIDVKEMVSGAWGVGGVARAFTGTVSNSIINVLNLDATDANSGAIAFRTWSGNAWENTYVLTDTMLYYGNGTNSSYKGSLYTSVTAYNGSGSQNYTNYSKEIWDLEGYVLPVFKTYNGTNIAWRDISDGAGVFAEKKSTSDARIKLENVTEISGVTFEGKALQYTFANGVLSISRESVDLLPYGEQRLVLQTPTGDENLTVTVVDKLITTTGEFMRLYEYLSIKDENGMLTIDGYLMLGADLDFSGLSYLDYNRNYYYATADELKYGFGWLGYMFLKDMTNAEVTAYTSLLSQYHGNGDVGFIGVFDGAGHTIKGLTVAPLGIFPSVGEAGVIKNVAFADLVLCKEAYLFGTTVMGKVSNVLIDIKKDSSSAAAGICDLFFGTLENTVIYYPTQINGKNFAAIARRHSDSAKVVNCYVITSEVGVVFGDDMSGEYAYQYKGIQAFKAATHDYSAFDTEIWDLETYEVPVFKTYDGENVATKK